MAEGDSENTAEQIPHEDLVSRAYFEIPNEIAPESDFPFRYDKTRDERAESVYWRKYAPLIAEIHSRGCVIEKFKNERRAAASQVPCKYKGARTAVVGTLRSLKTQRCHSFQVIHPPENGDRAHTHIAISPAAGTRVEKIKTNDRIELASLLIQHFLSFAPHECAK